MNSVNDFYPVISIHMLYLFIYTLIYQKITLKFIISFYFSIISFNKLLYQNNTSIEIIFQIY